MKVLKWCWGLVGSGAVILLYPYAFVLALILSAIDDVNFRIDNEKKIYNNKKEK